jgi:hypothetical protein
MEKTLYIKDEMLSVAFKNNLKKELMRYIFKYGMERVAAELIRRKEIKNIWELDKQVASSIEQLSMFEDDKK